MAVEREREREAKWGKKKIISTEFLNIPSVRCIFRRVPESQLKTQKWKIVSARQTLLLQQGAEAHSHSKHKDQAIGPHFYSWQWALPPYLDWLSSG
jgi:hypothetical protein